MKISLHLGAHRTASTVFQFYLRENAKALLGHRIGIWGPPRTRDGLLSGVVPVSGSGESPAAQFHTARTRIQQALDGARAKGLTHLVISDENMIGASRRNLRDCALYCDLAERMALFERAFAGRVSQMVLSIRSQESYWSSVAAFAVGRGHKLPDDAAVDRLVAAERHWREVITDLASAMPGAVIKVLPYEIWGGLPECKLSLITGLENPPMQHAREWINRAPSLPQLRQILRDRGADLTRLTRGEGRWHPFDHGQTMALREAYADDLFWLRAGAEGKATLIEKTRTGQMGITPHRTMTERGQTDGIEERRLA